MSLLGTHRSNPATDDLERYLTIALTPSHPQRSRAELLLRMDPYYSMLPGMKQFTRLLTRAEEGDASALERAAMLASYLVQGMAVIEDGLTQAGPV